jgi:hypothetical protein
MPQALSPSSGLSLQIESVTLFHFPSACLSAFTLGPGDCPLTHSTFPFVFLFLFAEYRAFEHTEQRLTECLGHSADFLKKASVTDDLEPQAEYTACYQNYQPGQASEILLGPVLTANNLTHQSCYAFCSSGADGGAPGGPYDLFGLTLGNTCRCSNTLAYPGVKSQKCVLGASGNSTQIAGARDAITVYRRRQPVRSPSSCSPTQGSALHKPFIS